VPIVCVPNGVDAEGLPRLDQQRFPGLSVAYAGRLYGSRDLGPVLGALGMFLQRHPQAGRAGSRLRIAGPADSYHTRVFKDAAAAAGVEPYVEMLGVLPRAEALEVVSRSRLAVVLAQEQELQIPAKLYESVAMRVPTLVVAPPDSAAGIEGKRLGALVCDSGDVAGIAGVLEQLWRDGVRDQPPCPVPITYDAIARLVDRLLVTGVPGTFTRPAAASV
jgi:glycosyltransferase involved in cell wall biosynthesis